MSEEIINGLQIVVCLLTIAIALFLIAIPFYHESTVSASFLNVFARLFSP
jgi:hypothetical protein